MYAVVFRKMAVTVVISLPRFGPGAHIGSGLELRQRLLHEAVHRHVESEISLLLGRRSVLLWPALPPRAKGGEAERAASALAAEESWRMTRTEALSVLEADFDVLASHLKPSALCASLFSLTNANFEPFCKTTTDGVLAQSSPPLDRSGGVNYDGLQRLREASPPFLRQLLSAEV